MKAWTIAGATGAMICSAAFSAQAATLTARDAASLTAMLAQAKGGDTIRLEPGQYGGLKLANFDRGGRVTLASANTARSAVFTALDIRASAHLLLTGIEVASRL